MLNSHLSKQAIGYKCFACILSLFAALPAAQGASDYNSQSWSINLDPPLPPRRPTTFTPPLPPARPKDLSGMSTPSVKSVQVLKPAQVEAPIPQPPRRPSSFDSTASAAPAKVAPKAAPVKTAEPKQAAVPAKPEPKEKGAEAVSSCAAQSQTVKKQFNDQIDQAITKLQQRMQELKSQSNALGGNLQAMLANAGCISQDSAITGGFAQSEITKGLKQPADKEGHNAPQAAKLMPEYLDKGFTEGGQTYLGIQSLVAELQAAKQKWTALDLCSINICQGADSAIADVIKPIPPKFAAVKETIVNIQKGLDKANVEAGPKEQQQLLEYTTGSACTANGMASAVKGGISGWSNVQRVFNAIKTDIDKHAAVFNVNTLSKLNSTTCSSLAASK